MKIELTNKEFRRLLDLIYVGNWVLNSTRDDDRFSDYDDVQEKLFAECLKIGAHTLIEIRQDGKLLPSEAYLDGGIHEAIMEYEDKVFFEILAEELARRDMDNVPITGENFKELARRMDEYIEEFEQNGMDNISLDK